jgi:hypothetical protein
MEFGRNVARVHLKTKLCVVAVLHLNQSQTLNWQMSSREELLPLPNKVKASKVEKKKMSTISLYLSKLVACC